MPDIHHAASDLISSYKHPLRILRQILPVLMICLAAPVTTAAETGTDMHSDRTDPFREFLAAGKISLYLRYRFENVDDEQGAVRDAHANTLRTALGYTTGLLYHFGAALQLEDVRVIGREMYNNGGENGITGRAVVVDPEGFEIQQAYMRFEGIPQTVLRLGRQEIEHRQAPFHRYIGNILWRQNWQGFDAFRATTTYIPDTTIDYAYVWNTNRIFGEDNPVPDRSDFPMDSHFINAQYTGFRFGKFEPYIYLLDFSHAVSERFSTQTYGLRFDGAWPVTTKARVIYTGEYARQSDYAENPDDIGVNYGLGELGVNYTIGSTVESVLLKASYEVLEGDGGVRSFQTPLGTNHAFQGWADRFLVTPGDGIEDLFITFKAVILGANLIAVYHDLNSDRDGYDYGTEWDLQLDKTFRQHYSVGIKYAAYAAKKNPLNVARNSGSGQAFDLNKFWVWLQVSY